MPPISGTAPPGGVRIQDSYSKTSSWDIGVVPVDDVATQYHAIVTNDTVVVLNEGGVRPGGSAGILSILGDYEQLPGGALTIEIGGESAGTEHDQLQVASNAVLSGTFALSLINGFFPGLQDDFTVLTSSSLSGTFTETNSAALGIDCEAELVYTNNTVVLLLSSGDLDLDGLPSCWENAFGLASDDDGTVDVNNGPNGDPDLDGMFNLEEFIAGTLPNDPNSVFIFCSVSQTNGGSNTTFTIRTEPRRSYVIEYMDDFPTLGAVWTPFVNTTNGVGTWVETNDASSTRMFQDDFSPGTSGGPSATGVRTYRSTLQGP